MDLPIIRARQGTLRLHCRAPLTTALVNPIYYSARQPNRHARVGSRTRQARESNRKNIDATGILILAIKEIRK
jgi:hypothetical protein